MTAHFPRFTQALHKSGGVKLITVSIKSGLQVFGLL